VPSTVRRPPYDPEVAAILAAMAGDELLAPLTPQRIQPIRQAESTHPEDISAFDVVRRDLTIPGYRGADLTMTILSRPGHQGLGPGIFSIHGGGMVFGNRMTGLSLPLPWVARHDAVVATVDYRLAPEHPHPYPVEDCYASLTWLAEHAHELGIDSSRLVVAGGSAGGGLAAAMALLARDRGGPNLVGQMLLCPMLDDRSDTVSARQFDGIGVWDQGSNRVGWNALLGDERGGADVSAYAAPARATDLGGLPPAYIDVGSAEVFRDESVAYASKIWQDGGVAELHVWPGGTHGWENLIPNSPLARHAAATRDAWIDRVLGW
jgi:acetyl esterase/lipase